MRNQLHAFQEQYEQKAQSLRELKYIFKRNNFDKKQEMKRVNNMRQDLKTMREQLKFLEEIRSNKWCPIPCYIYEEFQKHRPKINMGLLQDQLLIFIPSQNGLNKLACHHINFKIIDPSKSTLLKERMDVKKINELGFDETILTLGIDFVKNYKKYKLQLDFKTRSLGVTKQISSTTVDLSHLAQVNEFQKQLSVKDQDIKIKLRIRQAFLGKEMGYVNVQNIVISKLFISFDRWVKQQQLKEMKKVAETRALATEEELNDDDKRMTFKMTTAANDEDDEPDNEFAGEDSQLKKRSRSYADETNNDLRGPLTMQKHGNFHRQGSMSSIQQVLSLTTPPIQSLYYLEYMIRHSGANKAL